ncbi:MAG: PQQ-binding-like beta-propeller repeat protein [Planctomycetaceae bacterium]
MVAELRVLVFVGCALVGSFALAEDWPMYRRDRLRTAVTGEQLQLPLRNVWLFRSRVSWKAPRRQPSTTDRSTSNSRYQGKHAWAAESTPAESRWSLPITAAGDALYFTGHDGRIVCLGAVTGQVRWQFLTGAAVTQAANYHAGRLYAGSDDGCAYCLDAGTGRQIWKHQAVRADRWFISYGRMSSLWPVRTDVMVDGNVAYFASGVFPHDGVYVHAVDARTGKRIWRNGSVEYWNYGIAGYPILTTKKYHCPVDLKGFNRHPMFRRSDGVHDWVSPDPERTAANVQFGSGNSSGRYTQGAGTYRDGVQYVGPRATKWVGGKAGHLWSAREEPGRCNDPSKVVLAGKTLFYLADDKSIWGAKYPLRGEGGAVIARDAETGKRLWSFDIPERPHHLIVANGRLFVSTRNGTIYCFAAAKAPVQGIVNERLQPEPFKRDARFGVLSGMAQRTKLVSGLDAGFAVVLDCKDGALAYELAKMTDLFVVAVFDDADRARTFREGMAGADLHGSRIAVWHRRSGRRLPVPSKTIDLVVSEGTATGGPLPASLDEVARILKPIRGMALFGRANQKSGIKAWDDVLARRKQKGERWSQFTAHASRWVRYVRPPLPNSGGWAGPRGGPGRTNNSHDAALKGPLGVVWYGAPTVKSPMSSPPLIVNGVMVCPVDANTIEAYDQYNGRLLWRYSESGVGAGVSASGTAGGEYLYVNQGGRCLRFHLYRGGRPVELRTPFANGRWGQMTVSRDGKTLWGQAFQRNDKGRLEWSAVFARETATGKLLWQLGGPAAGGRTKTDAAQQTFWQGWQAIDDGRIYFLSGANEGSRLRAIEEMRDYLRRRDPARLKQLEQELKQNRRHHNQLIAVDALTGKRLYDRAIDMTDNHVLAAHRGFVIGMSAGGRKNTIGGPKSNGLSVWDGATGKLLWKHPGEHSFLPVVTDNAIYAEPWAYDLKTGKRLRRLHPVTGSAADLCWARKGKHCGGYSGSEHFLFGRNMGVGYQDTLRDNGMYTFWHSRNACNNDVATGGGMMIKPPYSLGCSCPWSLPFTVAMAQSDREPEASFEMAQPGESLPVKHVRLNFGAQGERRDRDGHLWIRPGRNLSGHQLHVEFPYGPTWLRYPGVGYFKSFVRRSNIHTPIKGTQRDFLFASGERGIKRCVIPLTRPQDGKARYLIRLGFCALPGDRPGQRVFDIRLNGKTVVKRFDAAVVGGGPDRAIWRAFTIEAEHHAVLDFVSRLPSPRLDQLPILNAVEIRRLKILSPGLSIPDDTWLNKTAGRKSITVGIANRDAEAKSVRLRLTAPTGLALDGPRELPIQLAAESEKKIEIQVNATDKLSVGVHVIKVELLDDARRPLNVTGIPVEYLGRWERRTFVVGSGFAWRSVNVARNLAVTPARRYQFLNVLPSTAGNKQSADAVSYLQLSIPPDLAKRVRRARIRVRVWPEITHALRAATPRLNTRLPANGHPAAVRSVAGPPWPNIANVNYTNRPPLIGSKSKLRLLDGTSDVLWADITDRLGRFDKRGQQVIALEPQGPEGISFYSHRHADAAKRPQLILDLLPE